MSTIIDHQYPPTDTSIWPTALKYGAYIGAVGIVLQLLFDLIGFNAYSPDASFSEKALGYLGTIVGIVLLVQAVKYVRDELQNGRISFGKAFGTSIAAGAVASVIGALWTYIYFSFINGGALDEIKEQALQNAQFDEDAEGADVALSMLDTMFSASGFALSALIGGIFLYAIVSLIIAAILKRD